MTLTPTAQEFSNHSQRRSGLKVPTTEPKTERELISRDNPPLSHHILITQIASHQRQRHFRRSIRREGHLLEPAKLLRWCTCQRSAGKLDVELRNLRACD